MRRGPRSRPVRIGALAAPVAVLALAACGGGSGDASTTERGAVDPAVVGGSDPTTSATTTAAAVTRTSTAAAPSAPATPARRPFLDRRLASDLAKLDGRVGVAVAPLGSGPIRTVGRLTTGHAWSTIKVPIVVRLLRDVGGAGSLSSSQTADARAAITASDNAAAARLFSALKAKHGGLAGASKAVDEVLRDAGDDTTTVSTAAPPSAGLSTYGQTIWSDDGTVRFVRQLARGCLLPAADTDRVLGLMRDTIADQRWGPTGDAARKGGWGPESDGGYLTRQMSVVGRGRKAYAMSITVRAPGSGEASFAAGQTLVTRVAAAVRRRVHPTSSAPPACSAPSR